MKIKITELDIDVDEILIRKVLEVGNTGRIAVPSRHVGKMARVIVFKKQEEDLK